MIDIGLPEILSEEFVSLIPSQRAHINRLMAEGRIVSYSLSSDRSRLWVMVLAESEAEAKNIVSTFPLRRFMNVSVHPLMFHNQSNSFAPKFSLN